MRASSAGAWFNYAAIRLRDHWSVALRKLEDSSVESDDGRIILYSVPRFLAEIRDGDGCFICGAKPGSKEFNNEHVIPNWVLRDGRLHSGNITMPNRAGFMYGRLVIPCCKDCNEQMAAIFEVPISAAFANGYEGVADLVRRGDGPLLWEWLALIFLKLQLKHRELRWNLNRSLGDARIADAHDWTQLHHIHCVVRAFHTGAVIDEKVFGSLLVWPANEAEGLGEFDFADIVTALSILIRIGEVFVFAVLNDSAFVFNLLKDTVERIAGAMTLLQGRELLAKFAHWNLSLEPRPRYHSLISLETGRYVIDADLSDDIRLLEDPRWGEYGKLMAYLTKDIIEGAGGGPEIVGYVREGRYSYLFDNDGKFMAH